MKSSSLAMYKSEMLSDVHVSLPTTIKRHFPFLDKLYNLLHPVALSDIFFIALFCLMVYYLGVALKTRKSATDQSFALSQSHTDHMGCQSLKRILHLP